MAPYKPKLTPFQQEIYDEVCRKSASRVQYPTKQKGRNFCGRNEEDQMVLKHIQDTGLSPECKRGDDTYLAISRLRRGGHIKTVNGIRGKRVFNWTLTESGHKLIQNAHLYV